jgi:hypothetical protein
LNNIVNLLAGLYDGGVVFHQSVLDLLEYIVDGVFDGLVEEVGQEGDDLEITGNVLSTRLIHTPDIRCYSQLDRRE